MGARQAGHETPSTLVSSGSSAHSTRLPPTPRAGISRTRRAREKGRSGSISVLCAVNTGRRGSGMTERTESNATNMTGLPLTGSHRRLPLSASAVKSAWFPLITQRTVARRRRTSRRNTRLTPHVPTPAKSAMTQNQRGGMSLSSVTRVPL